MTAEVPVAKFAAGVIIPVANLAPVYTVDNGGKFVPGVVSTSGKFGTGVVDTSGSS